MTGTSMRMLRSLTFVCGVVLLALSVYVTLDAGQRRVAEELDASLAAQTTQQVRNLEGYFERTRVLNLMLAANPSFASFYEQPGDRTSELRDGGGAIDGVQEALAYLQQLYPASIREACFIDHRGGENASVVHGDVASVDELSSDESARPFFDATFALDPGQVHQAAPYISPDTGEWVISNSTPVATSAGARAIVHFEVTLDSFREQADMEGVFDTSIVDGASGIVLYQTSERPTADEASGARGAAADVVLSARTGEALLASVDGERLAFRRVDRTVGNVNDWIVVTRAPLADAGVAAAFGPLQSGLIVSALLLLLLSLLWYRAQQRRLAVVALTDELTDLPNRTLFLDRARQALLGASRDGLSTVVALIDVDRFKDINDTLGHTVGDRVLREVGRRFVHTVRAADSVARLGGDEFALVIQRLPTPDDALPLIDRVLASLDEPVIAGDVPVQVSVSVGVAVAPVHGQDVETLVQRADIAMYEAKRTGLRVALFNAELDTFDPRRLVMVPELRKAIAQGEVRAHFQPKLRLADGAVEGVEVLARWTHPEFGVVSPIEFVSLAEETGLIKPLTMSILDQALRQCRTWAGRGIAVPVSVNLSVRNLEDPDIVSDIERSLAASGVPAEMLKVEITESAVLSDRGRALVNLHRLRGCGIELSLDDFGTGHSSLSHIRRLPVHELKIDRSFVSRMIADGADESIVRSAVRLGRDLGLRTVAEGVEDEETLARLSELGCDTAQGFLFSRPLPSAEILVWLAEWSRRTVDGVRTHEPTQP